MERDLSSVAVRALALAALVLGLSGCSEQCRAGLVSCGGACVDPRSDSRFCGASADCQGASAGAACDSASACVAGACQAGCPAGQLTCGGACVDPRSDSRFCGASADCRGASAGVACDAASSCVAGACVSSVSNDATLSDLRLSAGSLSPAFSPGIHAYAARVPSWLDRIRVRAVAAGAGASLQVGGAPAVSGAPSAPVMVPAGMTVIEIKVRAAGGSMERYSVAVERSAQPSLYVKASNTRASAIFGYAVALSGDLLAVGSPSESSAATGIGGDQSDTSAPLSGAVYLFRRTGDSWAQEAYLKASNTRKSASFGRSLALSGDLLVVGAPGESSAATGVGGDQSDASAANAGAVYLFRRTAGVWAQEAYLKASNTRKSAVFGLSIAAAGDVVAVGSSSETSAAKGIGGDQADTSAASAGAVYLFRRSGGVWAQEAYVKASNTRAGGSFGTGLSLSGDALAVGSTGESSGAAGVGADQSDTSATAAGAVYLFRRSAGVWAQEAYIKASNPRPSASFGGTNGVSLSGDVLAVGSAGENSAATGVGGDQADTSATGAGAVYLFRRTAGAWAQEVYLKASNTRTEGRFGSAVSLDGEVLAVAARGESSKASGLGGDQADSSSPNSGAVYLFRRSGGVWAQEAYVKASNTSATFGMSFGTGLSLSGGVLAAGAPSEASRATGVGGDQSDTSASNSGAVYLLR